MARCMQFAHPLVTQSMTSCPDSVNASNPRERHPCHRDFEHFQQFFAWLPTHLIRRTFSNSTQMGFMPTSPDGNLFKRWHTPNLHSMCFILMTTFSPMKSWLTCLRSTPGTWRLKLSSAGNPTLSTLSPFCNPNPSFGHSNYLCGNGEHRIAFSAITPATIPAPNSQTPQPPLDWLVV